MRGEEDGERKKKTGRDMQAGNQAGAEEAGDSEDKDQGAEEKQGERMEGRGEENESLSSYEHSREPLFTRRKGTLLK